jgi:hypothetical protein
MPVLIESFEWACSIRFMCHGCARAHVCRTSTPRRTSRAPHAHTHTHSRAHTHPHTHMHACMLIHHLSSSWPERGHRGEEGGKGSARMITWHPGGQACDSTRFNRWGHHPVHQFPVSPVLASPARVIIRFTRSPGNGSPLHLLPLHPGDDPVHPSGRTVHHPVHLFLGIHLIPVTERKGVLVCERDVA